MFTVFLKNYRTTIIGLIIIAFAIVAWSIGKLMWEQALPLFGIGYGFMNAKDGQTDHQYKEEAINIVVTAKDVIKNEVAKDVDDALARRADALSGN